MLYIGTPQEYNRETESLSHSYEEVLMKKRLHAFLKAKDTET